MASPLIRFRAVPPLDDQLAERTRLHDGVPPEAPLSATASEDLQIYYTLLAAELRSVRLTRNEALALCEVQRVTGFGIVWAENSPVILAEDVVDADRLDGLGESFEIDAAALAATCRGWTRGQGLSVVDAVRRFWMLPEDISHDEGLVQVGLIRAPSLLATRKDPTP